MDLSIFPPDIAELMRRQMELSAQSQTAAGGNVRQLPQAPLAPPPPITASPQVMPSPAPFDAPPVITAVAPPPLAPNEARPNITFDDLHTLSLPEIIAKEGRVAPPPPQIAATAPNPPVAAPPPLPAPQQPPSPPTLPAAPAAPPAAPMIPPPIAAPQLPPPPAPPPVTPAQITPLPQQAPVVSQLSPAPAAPAKANIDNHVTGPTQTFTLAYQPPALPSFLNASLIPNLGAYKPAPSIPGYGMPRTGSPFHAAAQNAPQLPDFGNPFAAPLTAGGGFGGAAYNPSQPDTSLFAQLLSPPRINSY